MAITGPASYIPTMNAFNSQWEAANALLGASPYIVRLSDGNTTMSRAQFVTLIGTLQTQQNTVQSCLTQRQVARGVINLQKAALLEMFALFVSVLDGYFRNTEFYALRPVAPSLSDGQEAFSRPLGRVITLWAQINNGPAPAGITLPLELSDETTQGSFASAVSALQFAYAMEDTKETLTGLARAKRNMIQEQAYEAMKMYREGARNAFRAFPELLITLPRLTPLPGHTPEPVNASAIFEAPASAKVVYDASDDSMLQRYELRGNVGEDYNDEDAVVIATNGPGAAREFVTPFGLNQPGAQVALKVYVILTTGNEAGSGALFVQRPVSVPLAA